MKQLRWSLWTSLSILLMVTITAASTQDNFCPAIVREALELTEAECQDTGRNEACYGHVMLQAEVQEGYKSLKFDEIGDTVDLAALRSLRLSALDVENELWGVALMRVQANLPNSAPSQSAEFLLFGDVQIENAVPVIEPIRSVIFADGNVNVRRRPLDDSFVLVSLAPGEIVDARGRSADGKWINIDVPHNDGQVGWISSRFITSTEDLSTLPVLNAVSATYGPMQAFYLQTGAQGGSDMNCTEAPRDGILIQTPEGAGKVRLWINEVRIQLGSTAFIQAAPDSEMVVKMIEGEAEVAAQGVSYRAPAGTEVSVRLDKDNKPSEPPKPPRPLKVEDVDDLPVQDLDRPVEIPDPMTEDEIVENQLDQPTPTVDDEDLVDQDAESTPATTTNEVNSETAPTAEASDVAVTDSPPAVATPEDAVPPTTDEPVTVGETPVPEVPTDEGSVITPEDGAPPTDDSTGTTPEDGTQPGDEGTDPTPEDGSAPPADNSNSPSGNDSDSTGQQINDSQPADTGDSGNASSSETTSGSDGGSDQSSDSGSSDSESSPPSESSEQSSTGVRLHISINVG